MKYVKQGLLFIGLTIGLFALTGCNEVEEILGKVNRILDDQLEDTDAETSEQTELQGEDPKSSEENTIDDQESVTETTMSDGHENEADDDMFLSFEERMQKAGYTKIDPPNGLSVPIPLDWVLIEVIKEGPWEGAFCFDTQLEETIQGMESTLQQYGFEIQSDPIENQFNVHATKFYIKDTYETVSGDLIYYIDDYGTTCTKLYYEVDFD